MTASRSPESKLSTFESFKIWSAAIISGIVSLSGCGGDSTPPTTDTTDEGKTATVAPTNNSIDSDIKLADDSEADVNSELLRSAPDQWLQNRVRTATEYRSAGRYADETQVWNEIVATLENQAGAGYWVTAGARLSQTVAKKLSEMSPQQLQLWNEFQGLEQQISGQRTKLTLAVAKGEISRQQYIEQLEPVVAMCDQQRNIISQLFGNQNHLQANIAYNRAEILADQGKYVPALVDAERSLMLREQSIKVQHPDTLKSLKLMGRLSQDAGRLELANDCFVRAVRQADHVWGTSHLSYADHANDLGVFYYWALENRKPIKQTYADSAYWLETALRIREKQLGTEHLMTAMSYRNYGLMKMAEGASKPKDYQALDWAAAENSMEHALAICRTKATDKSMLAQVLIESATAKMLVKEFAAAEARLREVRTGELAEFQPNALSLTLDELDFRIAAACATQQDKPDKVIEGRAMFARLSNQAATDPKSIALASRASAAIKKLEAKAAVPSPLGEDTTRISALPDINEVK